LLNEQNFLGYAPPDETFKCEPPVVHAALWDIQVRTTGGTNSLMGRLSASHRWYEQPDGASKCKPPVVRAALWVI
ncbi:hypothetical protein AVEN_168422-1, partial [Araneus ventricosus]